MLSKFLERELFFFFCLNKFNYFEINNCIAYVYNHMSYIKLNKEKFYY